MEPKWSQIHPKTRSKKTSKKRTKTEPSLVPAHAPGLTPNGFRPGGQHAGKQQNNKKTTREGARQRVQCEGALREKTARQLRTPTRLGRLRPGADLSCLRQCPRTGPLKNERMQKRGSIRSLAGAVQLWNENHYKFLQNQ